MRRPCLRVGAAVSTVSAGADVEEPSDWSSTACRRTILRISGITSVYDETSKVGEAQTAYEEFTGTHEEVRLWFLRYAAEQAAKRVSETASV